MFGMLDLKIEEIMDELNQQEDKLLLPNVNLSKADFANRRNYQENFWHNLHIKESIINQKSSHKWEKDGDKNTRLFHETMKARKMSNYIGSVKNSTGVVVDSAKEVK